MASHPDDERADREALDELDERLDAVERALADGDHDLAALTDAAEDAATVARLRDRVDALEARLSELAAATQALRGYVGNVRSVDRDIERRADAALAKIERLEAELDGDRIDGTDDQATKPAPDATDERHAVAAETEDFVGKSHATANVRPADEGPATEPVVDPCRCANCGATRERGHSRPAARGHRERGADGGKHAGGERTAADGGTDEWARATANGGGESDDSTGGFLAGLRDAL